LTRRWWELGGDCGRGAEEEGEVEIACSSEFWCGSGDRKAEKSG